jgi:hypothetical protein
MLGSDGIIKCLGWSINRLAKTEFPYGQMVSPGGIIGVQVGLIIGRSNQRSGLFVCMFVSVCVCV